MFAIPIPNLPMLGLPIILGGLGAGEIFGMVQIKIGLETH